MARPKSNVPPSTRLRENQRRARACRKELIEDLQRRLHNYERKELQATLLMQIAARKVALENVRLRDLLISRGVPPQEIDSMIHTEDRTSASPTSSGVGGSCRSPAACAIQSRWTHDSLHIDGSVSPEQWDVQESSSTSGKQASEATAPPIADDHTVQTSTELVGCTRSPTHVSITEKEWKPAPDPHTFAQSGCNSGRTESPTKFDDEQHDLLAAVSDCFCPTNTAVPQSGSARTMLEMSCETAAEIIVGMRGDDDLDMARSELGCVRGKQCNVKNVHVLQIIDFDK